MDPTPRAAALLAPVRASLDDALARLPRHRPVRVDVGEVPGFAQTEGDRVVLSSALEGPGLRHPDEAPGPHGLDRWRRAAAAVLEAAALVDRPAGGPAWLRRGLAIHLADRAAPALRLAAPDLLAAGAGDLGGAPRAGVAVLRAWEAVGADPVARAEAAIAEDQVGVEALVEAASWILGGGLVALLPELERAAPLDVPVSLTPWRLARLEVPAHPRGGRVRVRGQGGVAPAWAAGGEVLRAFAAAGRDGCELVPESGGPVGAWELVVVDGFGATFGARGVRFEVHASGRLEVVLADAFVGSPGDVAAAERVGTSGTASGRWRVAGPARLAFADIVPLGVTVHGRDARPFVMPAEGFGLGEQLRALEQGTWGWRVEDDRLLLSGAIGGGRVTLRLAPA